MQTALEKFQALPDDKRSAFLALFAGAFRHIMIFINADGTKRPPFWGKAECEWIKDWENFYFKELPDLGFMKPRMEEEGVAKGSTPGTTWQKWDMLITDEGHDAREAYWDDWKAADKRTATNN